MAGLGTLDDMEPLSDASNVAVEVDRSLCRFDTLRDLTGALLDFDLRDLFAFADRVSLYRADSAPPPARHTCLTLLSLAAPKVSHCLGPDLAPSLQVFAGLCTGKVHELEHCLWS